MYCLNPLLESSRPPFITSLSFVRMDLGNRAPHISGVKFVSANTITEEITLDIEVGPFDLLALGCGPLIIVSFSMPQLRIVSDESLVAEVRMVPNIGSAALVTLRDLFLVGTLRLTLHPLCTEWPCFRWVSSEFPPWLWRLTCLLQCHPSLLHQVRLFSCSFACLVPQLCVLCLDSRPVFDFSLTAAKINLANVPFASEWYASARRGSLLSLT